MARQKIHEKFTLTTFKNSLKPGKREVYFIQTEQHYDEA